MTFSSGGFDRWSIGPLRLYHLSRGYTANGIWLNGSWIVEFSNAWRLRIYPFPIAVEQGPTRG